MENKKLRLLLFLAVSCANLCLSNTNFSAAEIAPEIEDDSEQDLSSQLQEVDGRPSGWSPWSEWSSCSRSCDGGVSHQFRTCRSAQCRGDHIRYRICNMQPCLDDRDYRDSQCEAHNDKPYEGNFYTWFVHYDDEDPCALTCRGKPRENDGSVEDQVMVVARLANKVEDGTRCRHGSLDMCIGGKCQLVGCDLRIGSDKQVDACGVCGGDGSSCARPLHHWTLTPMSACSATCGGGYKMSRPSCQNRMTGKQVEDQLCNVSQKPDPTIMQCNTHNCPPKWHIGEWGPCSVSCGGGSKIRPVHCVEEANNTKIRVNEGKCLGRRPHFQEACNQMDCPSWQVSNWSGCSVSCGEGVQVRIVECRDHRDRPSKFCSKESKPDTKQKCSTGIQCPHHFEVDEEISVDDYEQHYPAPPMPEKLVGDKIVPSESTFIPEEWSPCSVTCGEGFRTREVHCKIFLEFSRTIAKLPDKQCTGPKPLEREKCYLEPCTSEKIGVDVKDDPYRSDIKVAGGSPGKSYSWREQGYTHCSATCLGGVQELIVNCIRDDTQKVTSPFLCPIELKPEILMRTCNDHPCPPRWNYSDFSACSQSCGIGIQTREVNCIHEVTQGGGNTVIVPNNMCPQPPPPDRQYCNVLDCPVRWKVSDWSRCSKPCGGGEKIRKVECKQVMAQNHTVDRPLSMCSGPKPPDRKPCNTKSCIVETDKPLIEVNNSTFIQHDPKRKKISLYVGGAATVFLGTTVKIKCPVKRFDRSKIQWFKDKGPLPKAKKFKTSKKGALRIQNLSLRDSGQYTCTAGKSSASIQLSVRPKPGEFPTSEEIQRQSFKNDRGALIADVHVSRDDGSVLFSSDDQSHEQRPDGSRKKPTPRSRISSPTSPSGFDNNLNALSHQTTTSSDNDHGNTFTNSRGHRMVSFPPDELPQEITNTEDPLFTTTLDDEDDYGNAVILGRGTPDNLKFEWVVTPWTKCSTTCGENGFQMRKVKCVVKLHNTTQGVDNNLCEDAGLTLPDTVRKCGQVDCPKWVASDWIPCEKSKCFAKHTAMQRRNVRCILRNATVNSSRCNQDDKPPHRQECNTEKCVGKWRVGAWSECAAGCEMHGVKYRILQCVWYGTKKPAGTACKDLPRPTVMKSCIGGPCTASDGECKDHSMFCPNIKAMNMCKIMRYQQQCCQTCKN